MFESFSHTKSVSYRSQVFKTLFVTDLENNRKSKKVFIYFINFIKVEVQALVKLYTLKTNYKNV